MIHVLGGMEQDGMRFKTHELLTSEIFHLVFLGHSWLYIMETIESKTVDEGKPLYRFFSALSPSELSV